MSGAPARPLNPLVWLGMPTLACMAASTLFALPIRVFGLQPPEPVWALVPAFAWAAIRPSVLPPFFLLALGLFLDILWGGPAGLWPACLLAAYAPVLTLRSILIGQNYFVMWAWYLAACLMAFGAGFLFMTMDSGTAPSLVAVGLQLLATVLLFPIAHWLIERYEDADVRFR